MISRSFTHQYKLSYYVFVEPNVIPVLLSFVALNILIDEKKKNLSKIG